LISCKPASSALGEAKRQQKCVRANVDADRGSNGAPNDIFGAICPKEGKGAGLVLQRCGTQAMNLHLAEIAKTVAPGAHAAPLVDQAGWHLSGALVVPTNITIVPLPAKCPELNPEENVW
jgi:hypothetical protein